MNRHHKNKKVVLSLSGGMDSTTLLAYYLDREYEVWPLIFNYNSKHNKYENEAAFKICEYYQIKHYKYVELPFINKLFRSNLLSSGGEIPEGYYTDATMSKTVVPGRNLILISICAGYAESIDANIVAIGAHSGDHAIYPDCRPEFIFSTNSTIYLSSDRKITLDAPFLYLDKAAILEIGYSLDPKLIPPYHLTRTCYKDQEVACGKCGSCTERLEAFKKIGLVDPLKYEIGEV